MKKEIKIASVKGHFIHQVNEYLKRLGVEGKIEKSDKKLKHVFSLNDQYDISIVLLRWEEIKEYSKEFDLLLFGSDQWLESGLKSIVILDSFKQGNCKISVMAQNDFDPEKNIATSFPSIVSSYLSVDPSKIKYLSGSVETAHYLGIADQIVDIVETGASAKENGYHEVKKLMSIDAVLGTTHLNKVPLFIELGLLKIQDKVMNIAFDGNDNSGKSTLSKHFAMNRINPNPSVLVCPYSGYVGNASLPFLEMKDPKNWFLNIGANHWKSTPHVNAIYDRNILTGLTELIDIFTAEELIEMVNAWLPLPDVIFYCAPTVETVIKRAEARKEIEKDHFDDIDSLLDYHHRYERAFEFVKEHIDVKIVKINTDGNIEDNISSIKETIKSLNGE